MPKSARPTTVPKVRGGAPIRRSARLQKHALRKFANTANEPVDLSESSHETLPISPIESSAQSSPHSPTLEVVSEDQGSSGWRTHYDPVSPNVDEESEGQASIAERESKRRRLDDCLSYEVRSKANNDRPSRLAIVSAEVQPAPLMTLPPSPPSAGSAPPPPPEPEASQAASPPPVSPQQMAADPPSSPPSATLAEFLAQTRAARRQRRSPSPVPNAQAADSVDSPPVVAPPPSPRRTRRGKAPMAACTPQKRKTRQREVSPTSDFAPFVSRKAKTLHSYITSGRPILKEKPLDLDALGPDIAALVHGLDWVNALEMIGPINENLVREFYANFPSSVPQEAPLFSPTVIARFSVEVRGVSVDISPACIRRTLELPQTSPNALRCFERFEKAMSLDDIAQSLYSVFPMEPVENGYLCSEFLCEEVKAIGFLVRSLLTPTTQTSSIYKEQATLMAYCVSSEPAVPAEHFMFKAIRKAAVEQRQFRRASLLFPSLITRLCLDAGVIDDPSDVIIKEGSSVTLTTLRKSACQSSVYVEPLEATHMKRYIRQLVGSATDHLVRQMAEIHASVKHLGQRLNYLVPPSVSDLPSTSSSLGTPSVGISATSSDSSEDSSLPSSAQGSISRSF